MTNLHDARVEAAARELFHDPLSLGDYTWEEMVVEDRSRADLWRADARRVLAAADAVVTEEMIAEVLENHTKRLDTLTCCGLNLERPDRQYRHWAEAIRALFGEVTGDE